MGIMPADRELKWQRVFRRFGLPGEVPDKEGKAAEKPENRRRPVGNSREAPRDGKAGGK